MPQKAYATKSLCYWDRKLSGLQIHAAEQVGEARVGA